MQTPQASWDNTPLPWGLPWTWPLFPGVPRRLPPLPRAGGLRPARPGGLGLGLAGSAFAQAATGDLILAFRDPSASTGLDAYVDIGQNTLYTTGGADATGSTVDTGINLLSGLTAGPNSVGTGTGLNDGSIFGSGFLTSSGVYAAIVGTTDTGNNLFLSANASGAGETPGVANSTAWTDRSSTAQSGVKGKVTGMLNGLTTAGSFNAVATTAGTSWTVEESVAGGKAFGNYLQTSYETTAPGASGSAIDLYQLNATNSTGVLGTFVGTFTITSTGELDFTAAIPEPSTYAAILGAAVLAVALIRRRQQSLAL